jgi:hypothetical protein
MTNRPPLYQWTDSERSASLRRETLKWFASLPSILADARHPEAAAIAADVGLRLGNFLNWTRGFFEDGPGTREPLNETARSIAALAAQFREVGLAADAQARNHTIEPNERIADVRIAAIESRLRDVVSRLHKLEVSNG